MFRREITDSLPDLQHALAVPYRRPKALLPLDRLAVRRLGLDRHSRSFPVAGTVIELRVEAGGQVQTGAILVVIR